MLWHVTSASDPAQDTQAEWGDRRLTSFITETRYAQRTVTVSGSYMLYNHDFPQAKFNLAVLHKAWFKRELEKNMGHGCVCKTDHLCCTKASLAQRCLPLILGFLVTEIHKTHIYIILAPKSRLCLFITLNHTHCMHKHNNQCMSHVWQERLLEKPFVNYYRLIITN